MFCSGILCFFVHSVCSNPISSCCRCHSSCLLHFALFSLFRLNLVCYVRNVCVCVSAVSDAVACNCKTKTQIFSNWICLFTGRWNFIHFVSLRFVLIAGGQPFSVRLSIVCMRARARSNSIIIKIYFRLTNSSSHIHIHTHTIHISLNCFHAATQSEHKKHKI